jgi:hypothetical protein
MYTVYYGGTIQVNEAHRWMVLNLTCALLPVNFLSIFTSFCSFLEAWKNLIHVCSSNDILQSVQ